MFGFLAPQRILLRRSLNYYSDTIQIDAELDDYEVG